MSGGGSISFDEIESRLPRDPEARIKQPYTYPEPTGGFLHIRVAPHEGSGSKIVLEHHDDTGKLMNSVTKTSAAR